MQNFQHQNGESYTEQNQSVQPPQMENYDLPFVPNIIQPKFLDLSNPQTFSNKDANGNPIPQRPMNQPNMQQNNLQQFNSYIPPKNPNFENAGANFESMTNVLNKIKDTDLTQTSSRDQSEGYAISTAINNINKAIKTLQDVEYWIPDGKEEYAKKLAPISGPIIKALTAYVNKIEKL